jgi:hypothetical protein
MLGDDHLHIDKNDQLTDWLSKALKSAKEGVLAISFENEPAVKIAINNGTLAVDLLEPTMFRMAEDETGLFGKDARPTLSKIVTGSDDIQLNSAREFAKLKGDLKTD